LSDVLEFDAAAAAVEVVPGLVRSGLLRCCASGVRSKDSEVKDKEKNI